MAVATITAAKLRATLGANSHMNWWDTQTWGVANQGNVRRALAYTGITLIRDVSAPRVHDLYAGLHRDLGVRVCAIVSDKDPSGGGDVANMAAMADLGVLRYVEGQNETDQGDPTQARRDMQAFHDAVRREPRLAGIPVAALTSKGAANTRMLGSMRGMADLANDHPYSGTSAPSGALQRATSDIVATSPGMGFMFSEWGWSLTGPGAWSLASDADRARWTLTGWMEAARLGAECAIFYELMNNGDASSGNNEDTFGLCLANGDPTLAATAIRNMMAILADPPGAVPAPPALGPASIGPGVSALEVTKADGSQWLVLWNEGAPQTVLVTLPGPVATLAVHDPLAPGAPRQWIANAASLEVAVPTHPVVLEIGKPAGGVVTPPATTPPATTPPAKPASPSPTFLAGTAGTIVDAGGHVWTLVPSPARGIQIARDGVVDAPSAQVRLLAWIGGTLYQVNGDGHGWAWMAGAWVSVPTIPMAP